MDKIKNYEDFGGTYDPGVTLYQVEVQGWSDSVLVEVRDCKYLYNLRPPFGVVAVHGIATLPKEIREELEDKALSDLGLEWVRKQRQEAAILEAACAMFDSPKASIGQLKAAVRAYEEK